MKLIYSIVIIVMFAACSGSKTETTDSDSTLTLSAKVAPVQLTEQQKVDGWKLLFDGVSLDGWRFYKNKPNNSWEVWEGTLHCQPFDSAGTRADIMTVEQFQNFELAFDWKVAPQGNSGVIYRVTEEFDEPYLSGPEYQVLDDVGYPGTWSDVNMTAANYDMHAPVNKKMNPVGEWNSSKIVVNGNHVEHWLNGDKVVEYEFGSPDWTKRKNASKWKDAAGYGMAPSGHIDFQDHGGEVWYRNIMVKPLQ